MKQQVKPLLLIVLFVISSIAHANPPKEWMSYLFNSTEKSNPCFSQFKAKGINYQANFSMLAIKQFVGEAEASAVSYVDSEPYWSANDKQNILTHVKNYVKSQEFAKTVHFGSLSNKIKWQEYMETYGLNISEAAALTDYTMDSQGINLYLRDPASITGKMASIYEGHVY